MDYHLLYLAEGLNFYRLKYNEKGTKRALMRKLCKICGKRPVAINYYKEEKPFYRSKCDHCARGAKDGLPKWYRAGYRLKNKCDKCGHSSKHLVQFNVYHVDGNLDNCRITNLKTVCANCQRILQDLNLPWKQGDLLPDF